MTAEIHPYRSWTVKSLVGVLRTLDPHAPVYVYGGVHTGEVCGGGFVMIEEEDGAIILTGVRERPPPRPTDGDPTLNLIRPARTWTVRALAKALSALDPDTPIHVGTAEGLTYHAGSSIALDADDRRVLLVAILHPGLPEIDTTGSHPVLVDDE